MESHYIMTFNTDTDKRVSVRINRAVPDLPRNVVIDAMDKILAANCFDPANGNLISKRSAKGVRTVVTPIALS
jgi:hypothetical protein